MSPSRLGTYREEWAAGHPAGRTRRVPPLPTSWLPDWVWTWVLVAATFFLCWWLLSRDGW